MALATMAAARIVAHSCVVQGRCSRPCASRIAGSNAGIASPSSSSGNRNAARHPTQSVIAPAIAGPSIDGRIHAVEKAAKTLARKDSGSRSAMSTTSEMSRSPSPTPDSARAATSTSMVGANPHPICAKARANSEPIRIRRGPMWSVHAPASADANRKVAAGSAVARPN